MLDVIRKKPKVTPQENSVMPRESGIANNQGMNSGMGAM